MSNKMFISLTSILSALIVCTIVWLSMSIMDYYKVTNPSGEEDISKESEILTEPKTTKVEDKKSINSLQYILPSDSREITKGELVNYDLDTLNKAYNEIFARHGHDFQNQELRKYFNEQPWYKAIPGKSVEVSELTDLEYKNMEVIKSRIDEIKK